MQIDRILYPVTALGPGKRLCLWTIGCHKRCKNCANPELQLFDKNKDVPVEQIQKIIVDVGIEHIDGVTISGGEPFAQAEELRKYLEYFSKFTEDILIFTGYTYKELLELNISGINDCLQYIGVMIAGEYIDELNDNKTALVASENQEIHFFREKLYDKYENYMKKGRQIQNVFYNNNLMSLGIHNNERKI